MADRIMMQTMWIRYTGAEPYMDNLYRTGEWQPGQSRKVLTYYGRRLLRHKDIFEVGSGNDGGSGGSYDDSELRAKIQANTSALANKVDKVSGKGLSSTDFTAAEKTKLAGLSNYNDAPLTARVTALENAGPGTGGTPYDDTALKNRLTAAENALGSKVDKVAGKQLSTNDYTTAEKSKLAGLSNYNDAPLVARVAALEAKTDADTKPELATALTAGREFGGVANGTVYPAGTPLETIVRAMLAPAATPTVNLPIFATVNDRFTLEEVAVDNTAGEFLVQLAAQAEGEPVYFDVPTAWGVEVTIWNALTNQWQPARIFQSSAVTHEVGGQTVDYTRWTDMSDADIPATQVRITWTV